MLAVFVAAVTVLMLYTARTDLTSRKADALGVVLAVGATLPIAFRRRAPLAALTVVTAFQFGLEVLDFDSAWVGVLIALYSVGAHVAPTPRRTRAFAAFLAAVSVLLVAGRITGEVDWGSVISSYITIPAAFILGDNMRRRRERIADLAERAERAEREQELLARERVSEERARIARELHDVVAHSVSVMIIQAGAARRQLTVDPERATAALANIESSGRQAMQEMRRILGVLRDDTSVAELGPQPSLDEIETLVGADSSLPTKLYIRGERPELPAGIELSAYRVVQEALTNVRKHAGACSKVTVAVLYRTRHVEVLVHDNGRGAAHAVRPEPGHGLIGMRERVAACGGELRVGPAHGGGWRVRARFPVGADEVSV